MEPQYHLLLLYINLEKFESEEEGDDFSKEEYRNAFFEQEEEIRQLKLAIQEKDRRIKKLTERILSQIRLSKLKWHTGSSLLGTIYQKHDS